MTPSGSPAPRRSPPPPPHPGQPSFVRRMPLQPQRAPFLAKQEGPLMAAHCHPFQPAQCLLVSSWGNRNKNLSKRQQSPPTRPLLTASCALRLRHLFEVIDSHSLVCLSLSPSPDSQTRRLQYTTTPRAIFGVGLPSHPCSALEATKSTPCCRQQPTALHIDGFPSFASFPSKSPRPHSRPAERPPTTDRSLAHRHRAIARIL